MKNVSRQPKPIDLIDNAELWTAELMDAVEVYRNTGKSVPPNLQERYRKTSIKDALKHMYSDQEDNNFCCYCENEIDIVDYPHIEHRKPKAPDFFPESTYEWENLHLACTKCNTKKSNQWNNDSQILDAVNDVPVSQHLIYRNEVNGVYRFGLTDRGNTTIDHTDLNRKKLLKARQKIYLDILNAIKEIVRLKNDPRVKTCKDILRNKAKGQFGSLIQWSMDEWGITD